jgi:hypothetical protein
MTCRLDAGGRVSATRQPSSSHITHVELSVPVADEHGPVDAAVDVAFHVDLVPGRRVDEGPDDGEEGVEHHRRIADEGGGDALRVMVCHHRQNLRGKEGCQHCMAEPGRMWLGLTLVDSETEGRLLLPATNGGHAVSLSPI